MASSNTCAERLSGHSGSLSHESNRPTNAMGVVTEILGMDALIRNTKAVSISVIEQKDVAPNTWILPFEILRTIFVLAITLASPPPPSQSSFHKYVLSPALLKEPISFTHVCSWWRAVALAIPELWTSVCGGPEWTGYTTPGVLKIWMNHASRILKEADKARTIGLNLHLSIPRVATGCYPREIRHMKKLLVPIFWDNIRWCRSLNLGLDRASVMQLHNVLTQTGPIVNHAAPFLEDVELMFKLDASAPFREIDSIIAWLRSLPALRRLRWQFIMPVHHQPPSNVETVPWHMLQEAIIISRMSFSTSIYCLSRCTSATTIRMTNMAWDVPHHLQLHALSINIPVTTLPHLTSLSLADSENPAVLLKYLTLPALKRLTISRNTPIPFEHFSILEDFFIRSKCSLERLTVFDPKTLHSDGVNFLTLPGLANLKMLDICYQNCATELKAEFYEAGESAWWHKPTSIRKTMAWNPISRPSEQHIGWKEIGPKDKLQYCIEGNILHSCSIDVS